MEKIKFPKDVVVGKRYLVPCVRIGGYSDFGLRTSYVPINSYLHDDIKVIGFKNKHWHIDWRFVSERMMADIKFGHGLIGLPIPVQRTGLVVLYDKNKQFSNSTNDLTIYYRQRVCLREYNNNECFLKNKIADNVPGKWVENLSAHFKCSKLKESDGQLICPHKGVVIDKTLIDDKGNYVCPGHLLRFNPKTLEVVPNNRTKTYSKYLSI